MNAFPVLRTDRLLLRAFDLEDASDVQRLAGTREIAAGTFIPHPYDDGLAEQWIAYQSDEFKADRLINFAICLADEGTLIGSIGLTVVRLHQHAQLGYWIGVPYWNQGYCTEAVRAVLHYGFATLNLHRIVAPYFTTNPASGRVLQKAGLKHEGCQREHYYWMGQYRDVELYGLLRKEYGHV